MTDTPDWKDEPMDAHLRDLAKDYNRPRGEVPREAMWQAIAPSVRAAGARDVTDVTPLIARKRRHIAPYAWTAALAAGLVLGIMLEREVLAPRAPLSVAKAPVVTDTDHAVALPAESSTVAVSTPHAESSRPSTQVASTGRSSAERGATKTTRATRDSTVGRTDAAADAQRLYRLAARQTLVQAEALLTAYRAGGTDPRDRESMQQAGRWARDVLTSTRLLLDSPAARDPQFRALFTDLELVLAQIVQLSGAPLQAGERELIERAMQDRDLLPRLRSAIPAGAAD
jgi:hypothetical protein